ncbi:AbrB/MazE/SpoVT family DNA-binding domain-containing protein [bacterium]|nr:AbrB/MazE/SpoVT family DNA-binding domain-containing protein [bacterium]MCI0603622.1 AbrB/MazE/SpoVT family DNA-binding domain-containing protein [bacterium]
METTIDKFGRVLIPKDLRDHLGLDEGTTLVIELSENRVILTPAGVGSPLVRKGHILVFTGAPQGDLREAVKKDRIRRSGKFLKGMKARR